MEKFDYKAKDESGKTIQGVVEASSEKEAVKILRARKLLVISLKQKKINAIEELRERAFSRISLNDKVNFTRQFSTMITAGLHITEALEILELQSPPGLRRVVREVLKDIEGGKSLSQAIEKHPEAFDTLYVSLVKAGETAGVLEKVLSRLADNMEKQKEFQGKVKGAMIYPAIVIFGMIIVAGIMVIFVLPKMMTIYEEFQAQLPTSTKILLAISKFATKFWWLMLAFVFGGIIGLRILFRSPEFKKEFDRFLFRIPIIGNLRQKSVLTEFTRTLGLLTNAGILIVDALHVASRSLGSKFYQEAVLKAADQVERGVPLATALAEIGIFPPILPQMISVGEETGKIDEVLFKISHYFEQETEAAIKALTSAMEPIIMIILGIGVAFLMISVIMPIYNLTSQF
ncbi:MAG: type II secretion system F family protein [Microgenomates group bacterium]